MVFGSAGGFSCSSRDFIVTMKKIGAQAGIVGALAVTALGLGSGVATADQPIPTSPGMTWKLYRDDEWDDWDDGWRGGPLWDGPGYYYGNGPCMWVPPAVSMWVPPAVC